MTKSKKFKPLACGFHSHTDFSLDGASTCASKIKHAANLGRVADCVTDHGVMSGIYQHFTDSIKHNKKAERSIRSIHGIEAYVIDPDRPPKVDKNGKETPEYYHLTIHFRTIEGYHYFCRLTPKAESRAVIKFGERKPLLTFDEILNAPKGSITVGSGCIGGPVQGNILKGRQDLATAYYHTLKDAVGADNFFVEIFPHVVDHNWDKEGKLFVPITPDDIKNSEWEKEELQKHVDPCTCHLDLQGFPNRILYDYAKKQGDNILFSLDDHFATHADKIIQDAKLGNGDEKLKFYASYYMHTSDDCGEYAEKEMGLSDSAVNEMIDNSYKFVDRFNDYRFTVAEPSHYQDKEGNTPIEISSQKERRWVLPTTEMVYGDKYQGMSNKAILWELIKKHGRMPPKGDPKYDQFIERIKYELNVICENSIADFLPYFFVKEEVTQWAIDNNVMRASRGSGGASIILYLLQASLTEPLEMELSFDRMMTKARINTGSLPDIDTDWADRRAVIKHLFEVYGDRCALISSDGKLWFKSIVREAERGILGSVREETNDTLKMLQKDDIGMNDYVWIFGDDDFVGIFNAEGEDRIGKQGRIIREYAKNNPEVWEVVKGGMGVNKGKGIHAGGVVIAPGPISDYVPVIMTQDKDTKEWYPTTAFDMHGVEGIGLIKYDFLGLARLQSYGVSMALMREDGIDVKWGRAPTTEKDYEKVVGSGKTSSLFQIGTETMTPFVKRAQPRDFYGVAALSAGVRPSCLAAPSPDPSDPESVSAMEYYLQCEEGAREPYKINDDIDAIYGDTHGVPLYQEQHLRFCTHILGQSGEEAELTRRGIGKKKPEYLKLLKGTMDKVLPGRGWRQQDIDKWFETIMASGSYGFSKSHATQYALAADFDVYLLSRYEPYYWAGKIAVEDKKAQLVRFMRECGHLVQNIDIKSSKADGYAVRDGLIYPALSQLKGCGASKTIPLKKFLDEYQVADNIDDLVEKVAAAKKAKFKGLSISAFRDLIFYGAFDRFFEVLPSGAGRIEVYRDAVGRIKIALKSKSELPMEPTKSMPIPVGKVDSMGMLHQWRSVLNPMHSFDPISIAEEALLKAGWSKIEMYDYPHLRMGIPYPGDDKRYSDILTDEYDWLFEPQNINIYRLFESKNWTKPKKALYLIGYISKIQAFQYGPDKDKTRLVVSFSTGKCMIPNLTVWPDRGTTEPPEWFISQVGGLTEADCSGKFFMIKVEPSIYRETPGGTIKSIKNIRF